MTPSSQGCVIEPLHFMAYSLTRIGTNCAKGWGRTVGSAAALQSLSSSTNHRLIQDGGMPLFDDRRKWALLLFLLIEDLGFRHGPVWPVTRSLGVNSRPRHQFFNGVNRLATIVDGLMMLTAH